MQVTVEYFAQAREAAGTRCETVELTEPCSAAGLLLRLARERGDKLAAFVLGREGQLAPGLLLAIGDRQVAADDVTPLQAGDVLLVIPAVSGG